MTTNEQWHMAAEAADRYERIVARHILGPWASSLIDAAHLAGGERVLDRGGRVALSVWSSAGLYNSAVAEALARFVGEDTASRFRASRNAPGKEELERLAVAAGFSDVNVRISRMNIHLPRLDRFALE